MQTTTQLTHHFKDYVLIMINPIVLCGGSGTRLWPASRKAYPKQFAPLIGKESLYQSTLRRFSGPEFAAPTIMTADQFRFMASEQAAAVGLSDARVVVEPTARDTGPAILAAALLLVDEPDEIMLIAASDHVIEDVPAYLAAVAMGAKAAQGGNLVTFGVTPERAETGYGYLELDGSAQDGDAVDLVGFHEKPDHETAQRMLDAGKFLWNSGMFMFRVGDVLSAFKKNAPDLLVPCRAAVEKARSDMGFLRLDEEGYAAARNISFDYAIMENANHVKAVQLDCGWSDLGAWDAIWQAQGPDEAGVATAGPVTTIDCIDSYLRSDEQGIQLVGLGLEGIVAVAMRDAVLVADKTRVQDVKKVVATLRAAKVAQADDYPRFHRPWGWYETLCLGSRFQVKRIMVKPGGVLSLQSHMHRSEHWVVVEGTAEVTIGGEVRLVTENQGVYIPLGEVHRMANRGRLPMYLIEVQTGSYLGEDDIIRYEDVYDRN